MQKILEVLRNEDGLIIKRLSDRKILISYKIPMMYEGCDEAFDFLNVKIRYRLDKKIEIFKEDRDIFSIIFPNKLWPILSNKLRVKMKNIIENYSTDVEYKLDIPFNDIFSENVLLNRMIKSITINNKNWCRDHRLKKILND